jgi:predicted RNase H-like HicB family nuclease
VLRGLSTQDSHPFFSSETDPPAMKRKSHSLRIKLPYQIDQDRDWYVAICPLVKSAGQGRTRRAAVDNLKDAIALKIQRHIEKGTLSETLREYGFYEVRLGDSLFWAHPGGDLGPEVLDRSLFLKTRELEQPSPKGGVLPSDDLRWIIAWRANEPSSRSPRTN